MSNPPVGDYVPFILSHCTYMAGAKIGASEKGRYIHI